jgi:hypothetical protein
MKFFPRSVAVSLGAAIAPPGEEISKLTVLHRINSTICRRTCLFRSDPNRRFLKEVRIKGEAHKE